MLNNMLNSNILNTNNIESWTIYSKSDCMFCNKVKELLEKEPLITIINCDDWLKCKEKKEIFLHSIKDIIGYEWRTFPIVFANDEFIGGYTETKNYFDKKNKDKFQINEDF